MKKAKPVLSGCGCLVILIVGTIGAICSGVIELPHRPPTALDSGAVTTPEETAQNLHTFMARVNAANDGADRQIIKRVDVSGDTATLTVENAWHIVPYQIRLQIAQNLWQQWASIASPNDLDKARIKLVDLNGNAVGGSRALAGSLIWVRED